MKCDAIRVLISAHLDGETEATEAEALRAHLDQCAGCRGHQRDLETLRGLLTEWSLPQPEAQTRPATFHWTAAAVVALSLLLGFFMGRASSELPRPQTSTPPATARVSAQTSRPHSMESPRSIQLFTRFPQANPEEVRP